MPKSRLITTSIALIALLTTSCAELRTDETINADPLQRKVDLLLASTASDRDDVRNVTFELSLADTGNLVSSSAGQARHDTKAEMRTDSQFMIASISKTLVATRVLQLVESGHFTLDTPIAEVAQLPNAVIEKLHRIGNQSYGDQITLRHLLQHTSGLRDYLLDDGQLTSKEAPGGVAPGSLSALWMAQLEPWLAEHPHPSCRKAVECTHWAWPSRPWLHWNAAAWQQNPNDRDAGLLNFFLSEMSDNALFPPGEGAHYSDTNYLLLGLIIEAVRGNSLHDELATGIFKPLGMRDTYMSYAYSQPEPGPRLSDWYLGDIPMVSSGADSSWDWGGGGIVSTAADLNTFIQHLFAGHLFKHQSTLDLMLTPNRLKEEKGVLTLGYGLGIRYSLTPVGPMWGHAGAWGAQMQFFPEHGLSVAGTINSYTGTATGLSYELTFQLAEMALKAK